MCGVETSIADTDYGDHTCSCGVIISVYNPNDLIVKNEPKTSYDDYIDKKIETQTKEEVMPFEGGEGKNKANYLKLPKEGDAYDFSVHGNIVDIRKVENVDKKKGFNFIKKTEVTLPDGKKVKADEDCGYFYSIEFADGSRLSVSSWSPFYAMKKVGLAEGDSFKVDHKGKGEWIVEVIR
jgi:hypothetical protein